MRLNRYNIVFLLFFLPITISANTIRKGGDIGQHLVPATAFACSLALHDKEGIGEFFKLGLVTMGSVYALKFTFNRTRPKGGDLSFPSGHTGSAFWGATYLHRRYGLRCAMPAYLAATFVGFSRVHAKKHFKTDVIAGAAIAYIASRYFVTPYCAASPFVCEEGAGITFANSF